MFRQLVVEQVGVRLNQLAHWTTDERRLNWPFTASSPRARTELGSNCRVGPIVSAAVSVFEVVQATLDRLHLNHKLYDMLAVPWADVALLRIALRAVLMPGVKGTVAGATRRLRGSRRWSR